MKDRQNAVLDALQRAHRFLDENGALLTGVIDIAAARHCLEEVVASSNLVLASYYASCQTASAGRPSDMRGDLSRNWRQLLAMTCANSSQLTSRSKLRSNATRPAVPEEESQPVGPLLGSGTKPFSKPVPLRKAWGSAPGIDCTLSKTTQFAWAAL